MWLCFLFSERAHAAPTLRITSEFHALIGYVGNHWMPCLFEMEEQLTVDFLRNARVSPAIGKHLAPFQDLVYAENDHSRYILSALS